MRALPAAAAAAGAALYVSRRQNYKLNCALAAFQSGGCAIDDSSALNEPRSILLNENQNLVFGFNTEYSRSA